ncbi:MAG: ATP synthase F1 subunit gamma [Myxococcota bacterium]|jgi:F-type H+-transporting ATPase subunit gamma|nr:ATP synthase F1 subunit gamma [Myxococcota bacterium]
MPSLKDIRNRIGSVKNTKKITSAMKLVAAAKLRRAQEAVESARPYAKKMTEVIQELSSRVEEDAHPLLRSPEQEDKILVIVCTSNRGLCAGFNANLLRTVDRFLAAKHGVTSSVELVTVGRKGNQHFMRKGANITRYHDDIVGNVTFASAKEIAREPMERFIKGEIDHVYLVYNEFVSAIQFNQIIAPLLPLNKEGDASDSEDKGGEEYIYEPSETELLAQLVPNSIEVRIFQALLESEAAEQGSRMTAMDNATSNAEEMIDKLTLQYNRARQAYITKELVEIVSGAESLNG